MVYVMVKVRILYRNVFPIHPIAHKYLALFVFAARFMAETVDEKDPSQPASRYEVAVVLSTVFSHK